MIFKSSVVLLLTVSAFFLYTINERVGEYPTPTEEIAQTEAYIAQAVAELNGGEGNGSYAGFMESFKSNFAAPTKK